MVVLLLYRLFHGIRNAFLLAIIWICTVVELLVQ